jgi:hypothetical protein
MTAIGARIPPPQPERTQATFRVVRNSCEPCDFEDWIAKTVATGDLDCGRVPLRGDNSGAVKCVQSALRSKKAFHVVVEERGVDSTVLQALVRGAAGKTSVLNYDSSVTGGGPCAAAVGIRSCEDAILSPGSKDEPVECIKPGTYQPLCSQRDHRVERLDAPRPAELLRCAESRGGGYAHCVAADAPERKVDGKEIIPPKTGPNLVCTEINSAFLSHCYFD